MNTVQVIVSVTFLSYVLGGGIVLISILPLAMVTGERFAPLRVVTWAGWIAVAVVLTAIAMTR